MGVGIKKKGWKLKMSTIWSTSKKLDGVIRQLKNQKLCQKIMKIEIILI